MSPLESDISTEIKTKFDAVFEIKSSALLITPLSRPLNHDEQGLEWNALLMAIPEILTHCRGFTTHASDKHSGYRLGLWDYLNGREISISVDRCGGYNLSINAEEINWVETQLPLDLLFLKLLALDYTPVEFRAIST